MTLFVALTGLILLAVVLIGGAIVAQLSSIEDRLRELISILNARQNI
jgi:hypothetical protein